MKGAYQQTLELRAVRSFQDRDLDRPDLLRILEAGRWTGSSRNSQPWVLVVVLDSDSRQSLSRCGRFARPLAAAPAVVVLCGRPGGSSFDVGRLAQNMMLAADALGVASCPVTLHDEEAARRVLGIPADHRCRYALALGYPASSGRSLPFIPRGRRPLDDIVCWERFHR